MASLPTIVAVGTDVFWLLLGVPALIAVYFLAIWLKRLYDDFTGPNVDIEANITNMFTPHDENGNVKPIDIAPKGVDPVDWIFMDHSLSAPV
jgi:hypothetical protein